MGAPIKELTVEGFKSIQKLEKFELRNLNVLIGANGAGKSNFVELFRLVRMMAEQNLQTYVKNVGGGDGLFFGGPKVTPRISVHLTLEKSQYECTLEPTADNAVVISKESGKRTGSSEMTTIASGRSESVLKSERRGLKDGLRGNALTYNSVSKWTVYHFQDSGSLAGMRREQSAQDYDYLRPDASNIAPFLRFMREKNDIQYALIRDTIRLVAPFFDDFHLRERNKGIETLVALDWKQKGSDFPFQAWHLSDGTIRFACLATALLQPDPPPTIVIDEPELGLHPHALEVLAGLLQKASQRVQVIVSTQSAPLLSQFELEDVITVTRKEGASVFGRLDRAELAEWMKDYTLGELWQKNVVEAGASDD